MNWPAFKDWILIALLSGLVYVIWEGIKGVLNILDAIKISIQELNVKMAVVIEKTENHEKRLDKLEGNT